MTDILGIDFVNWAAPPGHRSPFSCRYLTARGEDYAQSLSHPLEISGEAAPENMPDEALLAELIDYSVDRKNIECAILALHWFLGLSSVKGQGIVRAMSERAVSQMRQGRQEYIVPAIRPAPGPRVKLLRAVTRDGWEGDVTVHPSVISSAPYRLPRRR